MDQATYDHYGKLTVEEFVQGLYANPEEQVRLKSLVDILPDDSDSVLDVGAGHGLLLNEIKSKVSRSEGIEITQRKVDFATNQFGVKLSVGSADNLEFANKSFDTIYCCEVLEHLPYNVYENTLKELVRVAAKHIVISVPNNEERLRTECPYCGILFYPNYHMRSFDDASMENLFPEFRLEKHLKIGKTFNLGILPKFLYSRIKRVYPPLGYCPACGYHLLVDSSAVEKSRRKSPLRKFIRSILPRKPMWHITLYTRTN